MQSIIVGMIYIGSALMVYNIYGFIRFARFIKRGKSWQGGNGILYLPIALLVSFLLGYLAVGLFGSPDLIMAGILFGGSIFVFVMYKLLSIITQRVIDGERLKAELRAVEESSRAKNSFLAAISHEMRTPMNVILGLTGVAMKNPGLPPDAAEQLKKIDRSARHLLGLITDILDFQRTEAGQFDINSEPFALDELLDQINVIAGTLASDKGLDYHFSAGDDIRRNYAGDATQIRRVLLAVLDNAVKYTDAPGAVTLCVKRAAASEDAHTLQFDVTDTGVGIDAEFLPKIFDAFSQEDASYTNRFGGSGMGLAAAKRVLDRMGGGISAISEKNVGSTFTITIPLKTAPREEAEEEGAAALEDLEGCRILVVEDVPINAEIVTELLQMEGADVEHAENGEIALDMVTENEEGHFDAVLMDLRMPVMDGLESSRRIRALPRADARRMPIIALTANAFDIDVQTTREAGMNALLPKPVDADMLYATLKQWINQTRIH